MHVQKFKGKVFGATFTAAEQKAIDIEIKKQLLEQDAKYANEIDAMILWTLHSRFGFGPKRLREFWDAFQIEHDELVKHYELEDYPFLTVYKLKEECGIDIKEWADERERAESSSS